MSARRRVSQAIICLVAAGCLSTVWNILPVLNSYNDQIRALEFGQQQKISMTSKGARDNDRRAADNRNKRRHTGLLKSDEALHTQSTVAGEDDEISAHSLGSIVLRRGRNDTNATWKMVDWANPITTKEEGLFSCEFVPYVSQTTAREVQMCVHPFKDVVSDVVRRTKSWIDCSILPQLWTANDLSDDNSLYLDIGANIGSCVVEMLLSTNATIVAFEPHPMNAYNLKKTVSKMGKEYQNRLLLFPIGLGNSQSNTVINSAKGNMGNSQIKGMTNTSLAMTFDKSLKFEDELQFPVNIERLDSILDASKLDKIRLVKMDVQGFECQAVDGMGEVGKKIDILKFEYEQKVLWSQMCTDLVERVIDTGLKVFKMDLYSEVTKEPNKVLPAIELYAARQKIEMLDNPIDPFVEDQWQERMTAKLSRLKTIPTPQLRKNLHIESIIKNKGGEDRTMNNWTLVDWSNPFTPEEENLFSCDFTPYISESTKRTAQMCVHAFDDIVSNDIRRKKGWGDCRILPKLWTANGLSDDDSIYLDIGANIGSCVVEMLLSTNATIVAFEPHPMNAYNLKKTVSKMGEEYQDRLLLFPIGLGSTADSLTINSAKGNMGNSQISGHQNSSENLATTFDKSLTFEKELKFPVSIERLDSILDTTKLDKIRLVKMDVQGFECNAIDGMGLVGEKIEMLKFEYEQKVLWTQQCLGLVDKVKGIGLKVFKMDLISEVSKDPTLPLPGIELYAGKSRINIKGNSMWGFRPEQWQPTFRTDNIRRSHSIDVVSLTVKEDFFTLFNSSAISSWISNIQNIHSITFIGPPSDYFLFKENMKAYNASIYSSPKALSIPIRWVNETHWIETYKMRFRCVNDKACQQLIKLHVFDLRTYLGLSYIGENILIVDSDTVWSREVSFIDTNNTVTYFERISDDDKDHDCNNMDPIRFVEAMSIGRIGTEVTTEEADEFNHKHTQTPFTSCRRPQYPNANGARHIVHFMLFQHDVMENLHRTFMSIWGVTSLWEAIITCNKYKFCQSRISEFELYFTFLQSFYSDRMHINVERLTPGKDWMNSGICDAREMKCCHDKNVLLKGCHDHRLAIFQQHGDKGDMCCDE